MGRVKQLITRGMYSVAMPFHPFGGAVDIIVVKQNDGTFRSTPWYVRFGKFQGILKGFDNVVRIQVNGVEADFNMYLDHSGEAYFVQEVDAEKKGDRDIVKGSDGLEEGRESREDKDSSSVYSNAGSCFSSSDLDDNGVFYEFEDVQFSLDDPVAFSGDDLDDVEDSMEESQSSSSDVVLITVPVSSSSVTDPATVQLNTPRLYLGPGSDDLSTADYVPELDSPSNGMPQSSEQMESGPSNGDNPYRVQETHDSSDQHKEALGSGSGTSEVSKSCLDDPVHSSNDDQDDEQKSPLNPLMSDESQEQNLEISTDNGESHLPEPQVEAASHEISTCITDLDGSCSVERFTTASSGDMNLDTSLGLEISLCAKSLRAGMGLSAAHDAFNAKRISLEEFNLSPASVVKNADLIVRIQGKYLPWKKAAHIVLGMAAYGTDVPVDSHDAIPVEQEKPETKEDDSDLASTPLRRWRLWFRRVKKDDVYVDEQVATTSESPRKQFVRTNVPTGDQLASLKLKEGQNVVVFNFSSRVLGLDQVEAHIYLWKCDARIVISDVDGTITKSDVLGQVMPLVGKDWSHYGITHLFSAIKDNGYQFLFLSARAIVQAYLTKSYLSNLKQDGKSLPSGPVFMSPNGLIKALYREAIIKAPHEFKIACLEDIKALFPPDHNPFYAGFGNRDTDKLSYRTIGIPEGKIFIINTKGEVTISRSINVKSYISLQMLVEDMFPAAPTTVQEAFNSWKFWKVPLVAIDDDAEKPGSSRG